MIIQARGTLGLKGFMRFTAATPLDPVNDPYGLKGIVPGSSRVVADWFPNKVLNAGRNRMGTNGDWLTYAQVGNGSTPPLATDTSLEQHVTGTSTIVATQNSTQPTEPYYGWKRLTFRFPVGTATGNLQEGGIGWGSSGATLFSRALIVDANGDPTTAVVKAEEFLDLTYEIRYYPPLIDVLGSNLLDGVNYDTTIRAAQVTDTDAWSALIGNVVEAIHIQATSHLWMGYNGVLGTIVQAPNGATAGFSGSLTNNAYVNNSYKRHFQMDCNESGFVFDPVGTRSILICTRAGRYQMQFDSNPGGNAVPKSLGHTWQLEFELAWAEKVI